VAGTLAYRGFWRMAAYWRMGSYEMYRSLRKRRLRAGRCIGVPALRPEDVTRGGAGVPPQAVSSDGSLVDDSAIVARRTRFTCSTRRPPAPPPHSRSAPHRRPRRPDLGLK